jgi:hypothetical protein
MSRPDLQKKLLKLLKDMRRAAEVTANGSPSVEGYDFYNGRATAFADCIRELEKAIEEAK